jgi:hypothetical protein
MRSWWAFSGAVALSVALGCGRSDLADELLVEVPLDASTDLDVETAPPDASADTGAPPMKDASPPKNDAIAPPPDAQPVEDAEPTEDATPPDSGPVRECSPMSCPNGCCYGRICALGKQNIACGTSGFACADCTLFGEVCMAGVCGVASH